MKFQELLAGKQINWDRVKLIRHNLTKEEIAANYERGYLELYQSVQNHARFRDCDMVISFLGTEGTNGVFRGCYRVGGSKPYIRTKFPEDFVPDSGMTEEKSVVYELVKTDLLADMKDRLVIDWGKGTPVSSRAWNILPGNDVYAYFFMDNGNIFGERRDNGEVEKVVDWVACDVDSNNINGDQFGFLSDGRIVAV